MIELVDLRYRPEVNTIEALAGSGPSEHAPLAEPIWTTTPEESGLGFGGKSKVKSSQVVGLRDRVAIIRALLQKGGSLSARLHDPVGSGLSI